jgi:alpha-galactosidase
VQQSVSNYKSFSNVVWHGNMYRLVNPYENVFASLMYIDSAKSKAIMFNYLTNFRFASASIEPVKLKGLDANKKYTVKEINLYPGTNSRINGSQTFSGDYLMTVGFNPNVDTHRTSVILEIDEVK